MNNTQSVQSDDDGEVDLYSVLSELPDDLIAEIEEAGYSSGAELADISMDELLDIDGMATAQAQYVMHVSEESPQDPEAAGTNEVGNATGGTGPETNHAGAGLKNGDEADSRSQGTGITNSTDVAAGHYPRPSGLILVFATLVAIGVATVSPVAIAASGVVVVVLIARVTQRPISPAEQFSVTYDVEPETPRPGDEVTVELSIENTGNKPVTDMRIVDTVPDQLRVVSGEPRAALTLKPSESATVSYTVIARRGDYVFGPPTARVRPLVGSAWEQEALPVETPGRMRCGVRVDDIPIEERSVQYVGELLSDSGGSGVEFYSTREYQRGDPVSRINWRGLAKRGDLSTITYREQTAADITIVTDCRPVTHCAPADGYPSADMLSAYATYQLITSLTEYGHSVGAAVAGLAPEQSQTSSALPCWHISHGQGDEPRHQAFELFSLVESNDARFESPNNRNTFDSVTGVTTEDFAQTLVRWGDTTTQFIYVTPLLDDHAQELCTALREHGVSVVVISPDVTTILPSDGQINEEIGNQAAATTHQLTRVSRAVRIQSLRDEGVTVIDWDHTRPLAVSCDEQTRGGS